MTQGFFYLVLVVILGVGGLWWLLAAARRPEMDGLRRSGTRVGATVSSVVHERIQTEPGAMTLATTDAPDMPAIPAAPVYADRWYVECRWEDTRSGRVYTFRSDALDAESARAYPAGSPITVLIAPGDPDRYYVEIAG
jgi:hypothetical protein